MWKIPYNTSYQVHTETTRAFFKIMFVYKRESERYYEKHSKESIIQSMHGRQEVLDIMDAATRIFVKKKECRHNYPI